MVAHARHLPLLPFVALAIASAPSAAVSAADSLSTPITAEMAQASWPVQLDVEITAVAVDSDEQPPAPLPRRTVVVPEGHRLSLEASIPYDAGRFDFDLAVVARLHPRGAVELEWDLLVSEAHYRPMSVGRYAAHRLQLAPDPELGPPSLSVARSDIVSTTGEPFVETVEIDGHLFEIRIVAAGLRG